MSEVGREAAMVNVRRLAAIDLVFLGPRFVVTEYVLAVVVALALAWRSFALWGGRSGWAWYLAGTGLNYVPLLWYAVVFARRGCAREELGEESGRAAMGRYRTRSLWLFMPFVVALTAVLQAWRVWKQR